MEAIALVTILALILYLVFGMQVGQMRGKHGVKAPAISGHPEFERMFRVQQNTLEQLMLFLPALWIYGYFGRPLWGAAAGVIWMIGRVIFRLAYVRDPATRSLGFIISIVATVALMMGSLWHVGKAVITQYL